MFLPDALRDSDKALQYVINQFGFTEYPLVTARQMIKAATVFANHGMMGDVAVISPEVADKFPRYFSAIIPGSISSPSRKHFEKDEATGNRRLMPIAMFTTSDTW